MTLRKAIAIITLAAAFAWAPAAHAVQNHVMSAGVASQSSPWPVLVVGLSATSVILNGAIVGQTQCRELTQQEATASIFLPFFGMAFNAHHNMCPR